MDGIYPEFAPGGIHDFPRLEALSEVDWSPKDERNWDDFKARAALNEKRLDALDVNYRPITKPD